MMATSKVGIPGHLHMGFIPKIEDMDLDGSNLTQLAHVGL
jgi:hypothetical protein